MFSKIHVFRYLLPVVLIGTNLFTQSALSQKPKVETIAYAPPALGLAAEPEVVSSCQGDSALVHLSARAVSSDRNPIRYVWLANAGRIEGTGPTATWDLAGLKPGYYKAQVQIQMGNGGNECEAFASTAVLVRCSPSLPVCPNVSIDCPVGIVVDRPITFSANLAGGSGTVNPTYSWKISAGSIIKGQGTTSITVDTKGLAGQTIQADFVMGGYPQECPASCIVQIPVPKSVAKKFDEFPDIPRNDEKARLDNFAVQLQTDPTATAYVVVHPGQKSQPGLAQKRIKRIVDYLVNSRGLDARRIMTITGTARRELLVELIICPQGAVFESSRQ
jgi:hypothetical protein